VPCLGGETSSTQYVRFVGADPLTVVLDDQGRHVEYQPDGNCTVLEATPVDGAASASPARLSALALIFGSAISGMSARPLAAVCSS